MDVIIVALLWIASYVLTGLTLTTARRAERKIEDLVKKQEQQELYERMKNQQYNNYNNQL